MTLRQGGATLRRIGRSWSTSLVVLLVWACAGPSAVAADTANSQIVVRARATLNLNVGAMMQLRVDGQLVGSVEVRASTYQDYVFTTVPAAAGARVDVVFTNDRADANGDRNLYVHAVTVNGVKMLPTDSGVTLDRGAGSAAFNGLDVIPGQVGVYWNAALRFVAPGAPVVVTPSTRDAFRLADQATFGATEALIAEIRSKGAAGWITAQMALGRSAYTSGNGDAINKHVQPGSFCDLPANSGPTCWRDWFSTSPLVWDFYRNATLRPDQLRQRVAFALQQIVVVNNQEVEGTYGFRLYYNNLLENALGNYRQVLKKVALSPVMGEFLDNVNNDKASPNENFGRELLQLFSLGTCLLNVDGTLQGGKCTPTYDNDKVRAYAHALTGWTYPAGGATSWGCWPQGANCRYLGGDMVAAARYHDTNQRVLLSGVVVPAGSTAPQALELVLDSLMKHPNMAPFIGRQLIQHLVTGNPSAAYVQRVAAAFSSGRFFSGGYGFGTGQRGDLAATAAAVLLDAEARIASPARTAGKLREPVLLFTAVLRGLNGRSDGDSLAWWWGEGLRQHVFRPPSVFNFYPSDYPAPGSTLNGPEFGLHNANSALERLNFLTYLLYWGGSVPSTSVPGAFGTRVDIAAFETDAADPAKLVDRLSVVATGNTLPTGTRNAIVTAVSSFTLANNGNTWKSERVRQAAYLVYASPNFHIQR